jgi:hypothetical protein
MFDATTIITEMGMESPGILHKNKAIKYLIKRLSRD